MDNNAKQTKECEQEFTKENKLKFTTTDLNTLLNFGMEHP